MLKTNVIKAHAIVAIKLITGEEIIARLIEDGDRAIRIANPLSMVMADSPDNPEQTRVMFAPWMVAADNEVVEIKGSNVVALTRARKDAADQYQAALGTSDDVKEEA